MKNDIRYQPQNQIFSSNSMARHRLDAGTFGTMGVGPGFAIAAAVYCRDHDPSSRVICVEGDSAFGFSGMEIETMTRHKLPIIIVIFNNNGIYRYRIYQLLTRRIMKRKNVEKI